MAQLPKPRRCVKCGCDARYLVLETASLYEAVYFCRKCGCRTRRFTDIKDRREKVQVVCTAAMLLLAAVKLLGLG
jgi:hypothetical protein